MYQWKHFVFQIKNIKSSYYGRMGTTFICNKVFNPQDDTSRILLLRLHFYVGKVSINSIQLEKHSWVFWFNRSISLQFSRWFLHWFNNFGPEEDFFPPCVSELYGFFKEKSTFQYGYQLINFLACQGIAWIMSWEYINSTCSHDVPYLAR